ncbi:hypothetical protein CLU79DRAFT_380134 [Phycomyces nitens]|nr:hypothetical protein CLU79DRAFT_380134 [Phycomyces nitens]
MYKELNTFKQRHLQQNHELVQSNISYALKIQNLTKELRDLRHENISLRKSLIHYRSTMAETRLNDNPCQCQANQQNNNEKNDTQTPLDIPVQEQEDKYSVLDDKPETIEICTPEIGRSKRSRLRKCYTMPSVKSKLRKGDPFTFGNEK